MEAASNNRGVIAVIIIAALVLALIGFVLLVNSGEEPVAESGQFESAAATVTSAATVEGSPSAAVPTEEVITEEVSPTVTMEQVEPTARVGLQATDPGLVNLASGDIQLVEFFAFW
jgi:hypothetical protein